MERARAEDMGDDVERKGLGTPKSMLEGKKTLVKGLKGKKGSCDTYLIPEGTTDYSYIKDGKEIKGFQYKVKLEFPKKKNREE